MGIARENRLGLLERPRCVPAMAIDTRNFNEDVERMVEFFDGLDDVQRLNVPGKRRPGRVAVFAREDQLRISESEGRFLDRTVITRMVIVDTGQRRGLARARRVQQFFGLFAVLFEVGAKGKTAFGHTILLSGCAWSVRTIRLKEDSSDCRC